MTSEDFQRLVWEGKIPYDAIYNFNWDLDASVFDDSLSVNWESQQAWFPQADPIVQDVYAEASAPAAVYSDGGGSDGGGGGSISSPIEIDVFAADVIPPYTSSVPAVFTETASAAALPETPLETLVIEKEVFAPVQNSTEETTMGQFGEEAILTGMLGGALEDLGPTLIKGALGGIAGLTASSAVSDLASLFGITTSETQAAPKASLITGSCPPGLRRRTVAWGRDICVKPRRMNPLNPKALMRATRRLAGFQHFAVKTEKAIQQSFRKAGVHAPRRISGGKCGTCRKSACSCR